jgi:hypothetical protein
LCVINPKGTIVTDYVKVEGHDGLVRDRNSKAIVNMNQAGYQAYVAQRDALMRRQSQIDENTQDIRELKQDLSEIKQLLQILVQKA